MTQQEADQILAVLERVLDEQVALLVAEIGCLPNPDQPQAVH